jgi:hypothetical protein
MFLFLLDFFGIYRVSATAAGKNEGTLPHDSPIFNL